MYILIVEDSNPREISEELAKAFFAAYGENCIVYDDKYATITRATKTILKQHIVHIKPLAS